MHTTDEWWDWIDELLAEGFGRYNQDGWRQWFQRMLEQHGPSAPRTITGGSDSSARRAITDGGDSGPSARRMVTAHDEESG